MNSDVNNVEKEDKTPPSSVWGLKLTYFFLFGSYGSIWPYLALYFRQNGLNAGYVGAIAGVRPMIQFISCPFWAIIADKYHAPRIILNMSVISWLVMTLFLFIPRPKTIQCPQNIAKNLSAGLLYDSPDFHNKTSLMNVEEIAGKKNFISKIKSLIVNSPEISHVLDSHHLTVYATPNKTESNETANIITVRSISGSLISDHSKFNVFLYDHQEVMSIFWALFVLTVVGEFFEAPSVSLLDTAVLQSIENYHKYGHVRLYGSLGFGISSFIVGLTLDHVRKTICDKEVTNFIVIMYFFIAWMAFTIVLCLVYVKFPKVDENLPPQDVSIFSTLKIFKNPLYAIFLVTSYYLGFAHGSIMNFINWYLEDMGANRFMMGTATILRDLAVVVGFYISPKILVSFKIKHILFWVFSVYVFSYFSYSLIPTPWMAVPVEALQGLAFSIMWSSCINHLVQVSTPSNFVTMQGIIQAVYWGLGTGTGAVVGGLSIQYFGSQLSFRFGGYVTVVAMFLFLFSYTIAELMEKKT